MKYYLSIYIIFYSISFFSQKEADKWYFPGSTPHPAIDFSSGSPVLLTNNGISGTAFEGGATISDNLGNLLFYTDGNRKLYNRNHLVTPNGNDVWMHNSVTQGSIFIPKPGNSNIYYLIHIGLPTFGSSNYNLYYSEIDLSLNGGLGDITTNKNIVIASSSGDCSEKLAVTKHCNNNDYWIITHDINTNLFRAYLVTNTGITTTPITSNVGLSFNNGGATMNSIGQMKFSPNGNKLALVLHESQKIQLLDFDKTTGLVSNPITINNIGLYAYGVEFSPDNSKLYSANGAFNTDGGAIRQWDLCSGDEIEINNSLQVFPYQNSIRAQSLQLSNDGKIYAVNFFSNSLGVINNPNNYGASCNYNSTGFSLGAYNGSLGLPAFISNFFIDSNQNNITITPDSSCSSSNITASICYSFGNKPYTFRINNIDTVGPTNNLTATFNNLPVGNHKLYVSDNNCTLDSVIFSVTSSGGGYVFDTINDSICNGQSVLFGGQNYSVTGLFNDTITSVSGCDTIKTLNLLVFDAFRDSIYDTICSGQSISFGGNSYNSTGFYSDTLLTISGCDSIVTLNLLVAPIYRDTLNENICAGDIFNFNGQNISVSGIYNDTLISLYHCDSIITLNLTVNPIYRDTFYQVICNGQSYSFGGNNYNTAGTYYDSLSSGYGCDSIEVLYLTTTPVLRDTIFASICDNQSYSFGGNNYNTTGNYSDTLVTASGCDSISTLSLVVNNHTYDTTRISICDGDSYLFRGTIYSISGLYNDTIPNFAGCDSISTLILTVNPTYSTTIYDTICEGDNYNFLGKNINLAGTYFDTLDTRFGCDSAFTLFLHVIPIKRDTIVASICEGDSYLFDGIPRTLDGIYTQTTILANGCDSITTLILSISPNPIVSIVGDSILCNNMLGTLSSNNIFNQYNWNTGENTPSISFYNAGKYVLTVANQFNCYSSDSIVVDVINCEDTCQIYVPNSFTPDSDGFNDLFFVKVNDECVFSEYRFLIFNRWGELLFESNNINETWDGTYKGLKSQIDNYVWLLEYKKQGDVVATKKIGHVNVVR